TQRRTRAPLAGPAVSVTWSTKWRSRWPQRKHAPALALAYPGEEGGKLRAERLAHGHAIATRCFGSLRSAWGRQQPKHAPGNSVRILFVVLSKPSVSTPRTR